MRTGIMSVVTICCLSAGVVLAHGGVTNMAVMPRMNSMSALKDHIAVLGKMVKGELPFDLDAAANARIAIIAEAVAIPELFAPKELDAKSEARPEVWTNWEDFLTRAEDLRLAATALDTSSIETVAAGFSEIGKACGSCHDDYRIKK